MMWGSDTKRLKLRPWRKLDLPDLDAILGDPEVMRFSDAGPLDRAAQARWLDRALSQSATSEPLGFVALEPHDDDRAIGYASLLSDPTRLNVGEIEFGIRLAKAAWSQGYASEVLRAAQTAVAGMRPPKRLVAIVDPHNTRSVRLMEAMGMIKDREVVFPGYDYPDDLYALS